MLQKIYAKNNSQEVIDRIVRLLEDGSVIIVPTDAGYALACHALKERAVERICRLKGIDARRERLSIVCADLAMVSRYTRMENHVFKLMKAALPGAFTFILPALSRLPKIFGHRKEVGIRMPDQPFVLHLSQLLDAPLMVASLPSGDGDDQEEEEYASVPELINERWGQRVDLIIDAGDGLTGGTTVVDCTDNFPTLIRQGLGAVSL